MTHQLPVGIHDFETMRTENFVYVDKTEILYQMITKGRMYFLARPRRFGKSLLISTLKEIFKGKRHLFKDLWIDKSDYAWEQYPVIWLDMAGVTNSSAELLQKSLSRNLNKVAKQYGVKIPSSFPVSDQLDELITQLAENNQKVVVLIDEYDSPLLEQIHRPEIVSENRDILKKFYEILKVQNANIRFILLTGVTKFSKVSVFSGLNNLDDISLLPDYATLLGYTQEELTDYFSAEIDILAQETGLSRQATLDEIKHWYNGYRFSEKEGSVYNPFSTLLLFQHKRFAAHWFATGTPTFLINLIQEQQEAQQFDITNIENTVVGELDFLKYEIDTLNIVTLLYQTGYLTIKDYDTVTKFYILGYPNWEVETAFLGSLLTGFAKINENVQGKFVFNMIRALKEQSFEDCFQLLRGFFANIPYDLHIPEEKFYQSIFYLVFKFIGMQINAEIHTNRGRIDAAIESKDSILIFELKVNKSAQEAIQQIKEKDYAEPYMHRKKAIYLIGVNFNTKERNVNEYLVEQFR